MDINDDTMASAKIADGTPIKSLSDALLISSAIKSDRGTFVLFRGQPDFAWSLGPSVFRLARWFRHEREMIRELISSQPQEFSSDNTMLDKLVRMQHYGLPTRLLDVTQNFLVALYFACRLEAETDKKDGSVFIITGLKSKYLKYYDSDSVSILSNLSNMSEIEKYDILEYMKEEFKRTGRIDRGVFNSYKNMDKLHQYIRSEKPYFISNAIAQDLLQTRYVVPKKSNRRIVAQSGAFLLFGLVGKNREAIFNGFNISKYLIPQAAKGQIIEELESLGITEGSLFPEIDKSAAYIAQRYRT